MASFFYTNLSYTRYSLSIISKFSLPEKLFSNAEQHHLHICKAASIFHFRNPNYKLNFSNVAPLNLNKPFSGVPSKIFPELSLKRQ